jgi:hypothetical protein
MYAPIPFATNDEIPSEEKRAVISLKNLLTSQFVLRPDMIAIQSYNQMQYQECGH